jgi:hypothetical protein
MLRRLALGHTLSGDACNLRAPRLSAMTRRATGHQLLLALVLASVAAVLMAVAIHNATANPGRAAAHHGARHQR